MKQLKSPLARRPAGGRFWPHHPWGAANGQVEGCVGSVQARPEGAGFAGDKLHKAWKELHAGDGEPFPDEKRAAALIKAAGKSAPKGMDAKALALALQAAWRAFHDGDFRAAFEDGEKLGPVGASVDQPMPDRVARTSSTRSSPPPPERAVPRSRVIACRTS